MIVLFHYKSISHVLACEISFYSLMFGQVVVVLYLDAKDE